MYIFNFIVICEMSASNFKYNKLHCKDVKEKSVESRGNDETYNKEKSNTGTNENVTKKFAPASTPVRKGSVKETIEEDTLSPVFMRFTQDNADEDVDVVWDWDSPRSEHGIKFLCKKKIQHSSPKIPRKQILFEKTRPKFNSLKAQLEDIVSQVTEEGKLDESDDCLIIDNDSLFVKPKEPVTSNKTGDLFDDDSFDEEMIKCSQRIEEDYNISKWCTSIVNNNKHINNTIEDDSFDVFLEDVNEELLLSQASGSSGNNSENYLHKGVPNNTSSPRAISRTNSVPVNFLSSKQNINIRDNNTSFSRTKSVEFSVSQNKTAVVFSQEDIERKRLEALALLERKRKQNEIERKRQEALERLNRNRLQKMQKKSAHVIKR